MRQRSLAPFIWFVGAVGSAGLTAAVDALLIVPMVEIDPALSFTRGGSEALLALRTALPGTLPVLVIPVLVLLYCLRVGRLLAEDPTGTASRRMVLGAPRVLGAIVAAGWILSFLAGSAIDLVSLDFASGFEARAYYLSSAAAIISTGLFGFLVTFLTVEEANLRRIVAIAFPDGLVSREQGVRPVPITQKLLWLWFAVSFFPLLVLALGFFTQAFVPGNDVRAWVFIAVFLPLSAALTWRSGMSVERPVRQLAEATRQIAAGELEPRLISRQNDDLGFLIDSTREMAASLREKQRVEDAFGRAVDPRVRDHILAGDIRLGGERTEAAVLFCDIRGFTGISEQHGEEAVVRLLNQHLLAMDAAVREAGGMINKFLGDGLLAVFGAPLSIAEPWQAAFDCAVGMAQANAILTSMRAELGDTEFRLGIGVHYGPVIAANVGRPHRRE